MATDNGEAAPRNLNRDPITGASDAHAHVGLASGSTAGGRPGPELSNEEVIALLGDLLRNAREAEYGFRTAAVAVDTPRARELFAQRGADCRRAGDDLAQMITMYGGDAAEGSSAAGASPRGGVEADGAAGASSELSMFDRCERAEDAAVARYRQALERNLPRDVRALVLRLARDAQAIHDQVRTLRDGTRTAH